MIKLLTYDAWRHAMENSTVEIDCPLCDGSGSWETDCECCDNPVSRDCEACNDNGRCVPVRHNWTAEESREAFSFSKYCTAASEDATAVYQWTRRLPETDEPRLADRPPFSDIRTRQIRYP